MSRTLASCCDKIYFDFFIVFVLTLCVCLELNKVFAYLLTYLLTSCLVASCHVPSRIVMLCHIASCHVMSRHVTSCHVMSSHVTSCHVMSRHVTSCHVMSRHVTSRHVTSCHVMSRHVTSRYVISRRKSRDGHTTNALLSTDFFHTQLIQIKHDCVRWLSRRLPIPYRISGI